MTLEDRVHAFRLHLFRRAQELGNVSVACQELGVSRSLYYQLRKRFVEYGPDGLHPARRRGRPGRPPQLDATVERQPQRPQHDAAEDQEARGSRGAAPGIFPCGPAGRTHGDRTHQIAAHLLPSGRSRPGPVPAPALVR